MVLIHLQSRKHRILLGVATLLVSNNLELLLFSNEFYKAESIKFYLVAIERHFFPLSIYSDAPSSEVAVFVLKLLKTF